VNRNREIIILGMHRSGTSALAGVLHIMGINMGERFVSGPDNPKGHWEDIDFRQLNGQILHHFNGSWDKPPRDINFGDSLIHYQTKNLINIKQEKNKDNLWGWKDPRTALTYPFYRPYLKNPYVIRVHRNHKNIAKSLVKRNNMNYFYALGLCQHYIDEMMKIRANMMIYYDQLIDYTSSVITDLARVFDVNLTEEQIIKINEFLDKDLRHFK
jgi:hypothetical protein